MKHRIIIILFACGISLTACNNFIDEENMSQVVAEEYYQTADGYESLVNACYSTLRTLYKGDPWVFSAGTDLFVEGRNSQPEGISEYRNLSPSSGVVSDFYGKAYAAIQRCNTALYYNDKTEEMETLPVRKGELKFLRSYYYFLLVQSFGGVSLVTDRIDAPVTQFERNTTQEVYDFVIAEMQEALQLVPETSNDYGRVTKRAIRHFLAKVYLTRGWEEFGSDADFEKAAEYADATIAGQGLNLSFEEVFWPGNEENEEIIFAIQFDKSSMEDPRNDGHRQNYYFGPYFGGEGAIYGYPYRAYELCPTMHLFDLYTKEDARFEGTFMLQFYERYYDYYDRANERDELRVDYYYAPKWAVNDTAAWRNADLAHRAATVIYPYSPLWEASAQSVLDKESPALRKFDDPTAEFSSGGSSSRDLFLARLAETYLIAAEAYLKLGQTALAVQRVNEVRSRAALPGHEADMLITTAQLDLDFLLDERARELAGEYHRWFDLKRTGKLMEFTHLYNRDIRQWYNQGVDPFMGPDGNYKILRPIPQSALDLNESDYQQNPGY